MTFPASLDHLILGAGELERSIDFVEQHTGVRAALGGVHPGRGTRNAVLALGTRCYLELLAPDPQQPMLAWFQILPQLSEPRLVGWMAHVEDLVLSTERLRQAGLDWEGPRESSRQRPDGRTLRWKLVRLTDNAGGVLPVLIEWDPGSPHPANDAPSGCSLMQFEVSSPEPNRIQDIFQILGIDVQVSSADGPQLTARIAGPAGTLELFSGSVIKSPL